jgi:DNA-binding PadR family transcriptional regulator
MLSPIEKALLASCEQWVTMEELALELWLFPWDRLAPTISFLRRRRLLEQRPLEEGIRPSSLYKQTELGARVLAAQRRKEDAAEYWPERRLHAV